MNLSSASSQGNQFGVLWQQAAEPRGMPLRHDCKLKLEKTMTCLPAELMMKDQPLNGVHQVMRGKLKTASSCMQKSLGSGNCLTAQVSRTNTAKKEPNKNPSTTAANALAKSQPVFVLLQVQELSSVPEIQDLRDRDCSKGSMATRREQGQQCLMVPSKTSRPILTTSLDGLTGIIIHDTVLCLTFEQEPCLVFASETEAAPHISKLSTLNLTIDPRNTDLEKTEAANPKQNSSLYGIVCIIRPYQSCETTVTGRNLHFSTSTHVGYFLGEWPLGVDAPMVNNCFHRGAVCPSGLSAR